MVCEVTGHVCVSEIIVIPKNNLKDSCVILRLYINIYVCVFLVYLTFYIKCNEYAKFRMQHFVKQKKAEVPFKNNVSRFGALGIYMKKYFSNEYILFHANFAI